MTEDVAPAAPAPGPTAGPTQPPSTPPSTPSAEPAVEAEAFGGVAPIVPGLVQAEEFDQGGEGVGYSDTTSGNRKGVCGHGWRCDGVGMETRRRYML